MKKDLLDIYKDLEERQIDIRDMFGDCDFLGDELDCLGAFILRSYGVTDGTLEKNEVCVDAILDFGFGEITKKKCIKILESYKK